MSDSNVLAICPQLGVATSRLTVTWWYIHWDWETGQHLCGCIICGTTEMVEHWAWNPEVATSIVDLAGFLTCLEDMMSVTHTKSNWRTP